MDHRIVLAGNLDFMSLGDILQLLGSNGSTGTLRVKSKYIEDPGLIYIVDGNPANASNGALTGLEALFSLFGWVEGEFDFIRDQVTEERVINKSRMEILLEGLRMLDDGEIKKIGPVSVVEEPDSTDKVAGVPFIMGPLLDYSYVVDEEEFPDGDMIAQEGKHGGWIWVVLEGVIEIIRETPRGSLSLLRLGPGAFIGSVASFLKGASARSATVLAVGDVQVGVLDSQRLVTEYSAVSDQFRGLIFSLDNRLKQVSQKAVAIYSGQNPTEDSIEDKTPFIKQGDDDERILEITQGEASIVRNTDHGDVLLVNLNKGDYVGRLPFLNMGHEPHHASVLASEDFEVSALDSNSLRQQYDRLSPTMRNMIEHVAICVSVTTKVSCDFMKELVNKKPD